MSVPKSVVKIDKNGVQYTSNVDAAEYYLFELSRAALRDVGKFVKKTFSNSFYDHFRKKTGKAKLSTKVKVYSNKNTIYPRLEIGLPKSSRGKQVEGFYAYFQEFGTNAPNKYGITVPKLGLLQHAVEDNISEIVKIESQYLSALEEEAKALALIDEGDYEDED